MLKITALSLVLLTMTACLATTAELKTPDNGIDGQYSAILAQHYETRAALFEVNGNASLSDYFTRRALTAKAGQWVSPGIVPPNADPELAEAHEVLLSSLKSAMNAENALWLARAQVNFDCWLYSPDESCKSDFDKAMRSLTIPPEVLQTRSVYFTPDSSELSPETRVILNEVALVLRMHPMINIRLVGNSDQQSRNQSMALRRAMAVRNVLAQTGIAADRITVDGEDHSDTILSKQTRETSPDPQTRRVDIILEPVFGQVI